MKVIQFPNWMEVLTQSGMPDRQKWSFEITIRWYLNFCRRGRGEVTVQSARDFVEWATEHKKPQPWQIEHWKEAIRWFFLAAQGRIDEPKSGPAPEEKATVWMPEDKKNWPAWKADFLTVLRRRHYSRRTEQSYQVWIERFARHLGSDDLRSRGPEDIAAFLDKLALDERLSASSQRQALNALVFLFREVFEMDLGDFSNYRRARVRPHLPVWLTVQELHRLLNCLEPLWGLMARVMYGGGLRLTELLRLRVKDLDLEQEIITVRSGKGDKDRLVPLAHVVVEPLRKHLEGVRGRPSRERGRCLAPCRIGAEISKRWQGVAMVLGLAGGGI